MSNNALNVRNRGLGRGLNALFEDDGDTPPLSTLLSDTPPASFDAVVSSSGTPIPGRQVVGIDRLEPSTLQPRRVFEEDKLEELASSIRVHGVLQPILVRELVGARDKYEIIAGERRWRAAQRAQLHEVPIIVLDLPDVEAFKIALIENLQREDLDPIDEARGYKRLLEEYGHTQDELASAVGKSRPHITNMVRLLGLPEVVQEQVSKKELSMGHARALITANDPAALAKEVIAKGLSVRQTEALASVKAGRVQKIRSSSGKANAVSVSNKDADTVALENDISNALGMRVSIDSADGKQGKVLIEFKSLDQLDEILHRLAHQSEGRLRS